MARFFKKWEPSNKVVLDNGARVDFGTADGVIGYFQTDNSYVIEQLDKCMREQRYGIENVEEAEYLEYVSKKKNSKELPPRWREEVGPGAHSYARMQALHQIGQAGNPQSAAAADKPLPEVVVSPPPPPEEPPPIKVNVGPRKPRPVGKSK